MTVELDLSGFTGNSTRTDRRLEARLPLVFGVKCTLDLGQDLDVFVMNISQSGCLVFAQAGLLRSEQHITLFRAGAEMRQGQVAWTSGTKAGVRFDLGISANYLDQLFAAQLPKVASDPFIDQFGRALAPLPGLGRSKGRR